MTRLLFPGLALLAIACFFAGRWSAATPSALAQTTAPRTPPATAASAPPDGPWIRVIPPQEAQGSLARLYAQFRHGGAVDNLVQIHSLHPAALVGHLPLYKTLFFEPTESLGLADRQRIGLAVSNANRSLYCQAHHSIGLTAEGKRLLSEQQFARLARPDAARQQAAIRFAEKLTLAPQTMARRDVDALRTAGFSDRDILEITMIAAYMNFTNRITLALGVPLESYWQPRADRE